MKEIYSLFLLILILASCRSQNNLHHGNSNQPKEFNPSSLLLSGNPAKEVTGQLLYLPVYSNVPYQFDSTLYDMSAFVAIHNTDLFSPIYLTKVLYFNQDGKLVDDFLEDKKLKLEPLAAKDFYIPYEDKSGTGAKFLIEWVSDTLVCEPLIESVTICLKPNNSVAVLSQGKVIREKR